MSATAEKDFGGSRVTPRRRRRHLSCRAVRKKTSNGPDPLRVLGPSLPTARSTSSIFARRRLRGDNRRRRWVGYTLTRLQALTVKGEALSKLLAAARAEDDGSGHF